MDAPSLRPAALVVNVKARQGARGFTTARAALEAEGLTLAEAIPLREPQRLPEVVEGLLNQGVRLLWVGSGDGSLGALVPALLRHGACLGVLPLGTANDFARSLGIPRKLEEACRALSRGQVARVDVARAGDRYFLNAASVGLTVAVARHLDPTLKRRLGALAYPVAATRALFSHRPFRVTLTVDGRRHELVALQAVVGNGRLHGGGNVIAPEAALDDAMLDLYVIRADTSPVRTYPRPRGERLRDAVRLLRLAPLLRRGRHTQDAQTDHLRARSVVLETSPVQEVNADGELIGVSPMTFEVVPRALSVLVPP
jgi:YegS/Rv2252/BmrU family lipid kinase